MEFLKQRPREFYEKVCHSPVRPAVIRKGQMEGHLKMGERHDRLYPIFFQFPYHRTVKSDSFLVGFLVIPIGKYP